MTAGWVVLEGIRRVHVDDLEKVKAEWQKRSETNRPMDIEGFDPQREQVRTWHFNGGTPLRFELGERE